MAVKVRSSFIISANSRGLRLHGSASSLYRHKAQPLHPLHRASHLSKILVFTGDGHIAQPSTISSLPPPPSLLKLWNLGALNPSPFFFLFTFCFSSDLPFLGHVDKGEKCSDNTVNLQASPIFVDSLCFWWSHSCGTVALRNYLVDLGRSVNSDVRLLPG